MSDNPKINEIMVEVKARLKDRLAKYKDDDRLDEERQSEVKDIIVNTIKEVAIEIAGDGMADQIFQEDVMVNFLSGLDNYGLYQESKYKILSDMLLEGLTILYIDSSVEDMVCPDSIKERFGQKLIMNLSLNFGIEDLEIVKTGVCGTFSFNGVKCYCEFPITSIWALGHPWSDETVLFYRDAPDKFLEAMDIDKVEVDLAQYTAKEKEKKMEEKKKKRSHLSVVKN